MLNGLSNEHSQDDEKAIDPAILAVAAAMQDEGATAEQIEDNKVARQIEQIKRGRVQALFTTKALHRDGPEREWLDNNLPNFDAIDHMTVATMERLLNEASDLGFRV